MPESQRHRVVIIGGGFGGLFTAQYLKRAPVDVTLIDKRNFHLFQPLLYQVATGGLSPANISAPLRGVLKNQNNARVLLGRVTGIDVTNKQVEMGNEKIPFDSLVLATGATNHFFGNDHWEKFAPGLKSIEEATEIRRRILSAFEAAERVEDPVLRKQLMTFIIVGGGPTGVEMAGSIADLAHHTLRKNFRSINPKDARILLIEGSHRVLPPFPESLSAKALRSLQRLGVEVWVSSRVKDIRDDWVTVEHDGKIEEIRTSCVIWAAGVKASPLGKILAEATGTATDKAGRVVVQKDLTVPNHPNIFAIGDVSSCPGKDGKPLPGVAPVAMQQGKFVAKVINYRARGWKPPETFSYWDKGNMATIGRASAVVDLYWLRFSGWFAWLTWLFVHLMFLVQFQNRVLVFLQWGWNYVTRNRAARLITGEDAKLGKLPEIDDQQIPPTTTKLG